MQTSNLETAKRYMETVAALHSPDAVAAFYAPDIEFREFPNRIAPAGRVRRAASLREAFQQGQKLLASQRYDVKHAVECGDEVAMEVEWTGVLAVPVQNLPAGARMQAFIGMFLTFRDGKIVSQRNYDCYPPLTAEPSA